MSSRNKGILFSAALILNPTMLILNQQSAVAQPVIYNTYNQRMGQINAIEQNMTQRQQDMNAASAAERARAAMIQQQRPMIQRQQNIQAREYPTALAAGASAGVQGWVGVRDVVIGAATMNLSRMASGANDLDQASRDVVRYQQSLHNGFTATQMSSALQAQSRQWQFEATQQRMNYARAQQQHRSLTTQANNGRVAAARTTLSPPPVASQRSTGATPAVSAVAPRTQTNSLPGWR
jgi:hypothetical protein